MNFVNVNGLVVLVVALPLQIPEAWEPSQKLLEAAERGDAPEVIRLWERGADLEARNEGGLTALMLASRKGHAGVVHVLASHGADVAARGPDGITAWVLAVEYAHESVQKMLVARGRGPAKAEIDPPKNYDSPPVLLSKPDEPPYPDEAREKRVSGEVILRIRVNEDGSTDVLGVLQAVPHCTLVSIQNAKEWVWQPATKDGQPVEAQGVIKVEFDIYAVPR